MSENLWSYEYRKETVREKRAALLFGLKETEGENPSGYAVRQSLFDARYIEEDGREIDAFIRGWVMLSFYQKGFFLPGEKTKAVQEARGVLSDWHMELADGDEIEQQALYDELYNMTLLYMTLCETDKNFGSLFFGIGKLKDDRLRDKVAGAVRGLAIDLPAKLGMESDFAFFRRAAMDAFDERYGTTEGIS